jgi:hypothetical protein
MILIPFVLLLLANVVFAQAQKVTQEKIVIAPMSAGPISPPPVGDIVAQMATASIIELQEDFWGNHTPAVTPMCAGDPWIQRNVQRSGSGRFIAATIADMIALTVPVERFITTYASYDSGENQYSHPAVRVEPHIRRGSAWVSAQLRF